MKRHYLLLLLLLSCAPVKVLQGPDPYTDVATGITFPPELGICKKVGVQVYREKRLGISVRYIGPDYFKADIYIYNGGHTDISDGIESQVVTSMNHQARQDITTAQTLGYYQDVEIVEKTELTFAAGDFSLPALFTLCRFTAHDQEVHSYLVLTGFRGNFLKVRCTFPQDNARGRELFDQLIAGLAQALAE